MLDGWHLVVQKIVEATWMMTALLYCSRLQAIQTFRRKCERKRFDFSNKIAFGMESTER